MNYPNIDIIRPPMRFDQVISTYGYPLIGKEVAEAIYYARRIRSQSLNVERERERAVRVDAGAPIHQRKRTELVGNRFTSGQCSKERDYRKVTVGGGYCKTANQTQTPPLAGEKDHLIETSTARNRRTVLMDKMVREPDTEPG